MGNIDLNFNSKTDKTVDFLIELPKGLKGEFIWNERIIH